jgi:hypothetical protein
MPHLPDDVRSGTSRRRSENSSGACYDFRLILQMRVKDDTKAFAVMVIESHSGRLGSAHLHYDCAEPSLSRDRQVIEWSGTIGNLARVKELHRRLAAANRSSFGSVPLLLT